MPWIERGRDYLVITVRGADAFKRATGEPTARWQDVRVVVLAILRDAVLYDERWDRLGLIREFEGKMNGVGRCRLRLIWGARDGEPTIGPDGKSQCVYFVDFRLLGGGEWKDDGDAAA